MKLSLTIAILFLSVNLYSQKIDREKLVRRHNPLIQSADTLASLTVGNGAFAYTVDVTGLQTFPKEYERGIPLGTQSEWGWHNFIDTVGYKREEAIRNYNLNGRQISYTVQINSPARNKAVSEWFRQNPHRLQLGNLGFVLLKKDGSNAQLSDIKNVRQELDLWTGEVKTHFTVEGTNVDVSTVCHGEEDVVASSVRSALIREGRLKVQILFPYPTGQWTDAGAKWSDENKHHSAILLSHSNGAVLQHKLDTTKYYVGFDWSGDATIKAKKPHQFEITPASNNDSFSFSAKFNSERDFNSLPSYAESKLSSEREWVSFWQSGGAIDFAGSKDKRANELERRIILSQYQLRVQEAGSFPPQETGLTYNSWFGKPHLEMHWWHAAQYALWGRPQLLEKSMGWYAQVADKAKAIAKRQGFEGIRWQKMTDHSGDETPSSVGAFLIWQQPHFIYFAELIYRNGKDKAVLDKYKDLVFGTADFMASFPFYDSANRRYILGKGLIPAQERFKAEETFNPSFELVYWHWGLTTAQQWRERLGLPRNPQWDDVLKKLAPLPVQDNKYLFAENATDSYTNPVYRTDHPAVLGALGVLPYTGQVKESVMRNTFNWIWNNWTWNDTWGWDFPLTAMTATRLNLPSKNIDALMMNIQTNRYLPNGHNYQDDRLRMYLPGNGGLLAAAALMCAGFDGCKEKDPGIPKDGKWRVKWEGLQPMP
jgi:protein-glucosylgalactosylhydroxylysine glucosidase